MSIIISDQVLSWGSALREELLKLQRELVRFDGLRYELVLGRAVLPYF